MSQSRLAAIHEATKALEAERQAILDRLAQEACPFVVGDVISFNFELRRESGTVVRILGMYGDYTMDVDRLRDNGMPGPRMFVYPWDEPTKAPVVA